MEKRNLDLFDLMLSLPALGLFYLSVNESESFPANRIVRSMLVQTFFRKTPRFDEDTGRTDWTAPQVSLFLTTGMVYNSGNESLRRARRRCTSLQPGL